MNFSAYDLWREIMKSKDKTIFIGDDKSKIRAFNDLKNAGFISQNSYIDRFGVGHCKSDD